MRTFKWPSPLLFTRRSRPESYIVSCRLYQSQASQLDSKGRAVSHESPAAYWGTDGNVTFEHLGIQKPTHKPILAALQKAFPAVQHPTKTQQELIRAILHGKDVFLQDHTGTGKSFGILLALLGKKDKRPAVGSGENGRDKPVISSLVIVPHRDLAYQFMHWIERLHAHMPHAEELASIAQAVVRNAATPLSDQIARLRAHPPRILIGTPQALSDVLQVDSSALMLDTLSSVVVDEVDYLIESLPRTKGKHARLKAERQMQIHPSPTRQILDKIYGVKEPPSNEKKFASTQKASQGARPASPPVRHPRPQLIMSSATFRVSLRHFLLGQSGWFTRAPGELVRISGSAVSDAPVKPSLENEANQSLGGTSIQHHALVVSADGTIRNIEGTTDTPSTDHAVSEEDSAGSHVDLQVPLDSESVSESAHDMVEYKDATSKPLPFNPNTLEAVAEAFALDVPRLALLVLPASAPLQQVVYELRRFGVNAQNLDVYQSETGRAYLMEGQGSPMTDSPTLLVSTLATTRGLDLPDLTHVFILGVPEDRPVDTYLHAAGRTGRFGRSGKVISVLEARHMITTTKGKPGWKDEPQKLRNMLNLMGVRPTKFAYFPV